MKKLFLFILFVALISTVIIVIINIFTKIKQSNDFNLGNTFIDDRASGSVDFTYLYNHRSSIHLPFGYPQDSDTLDDYIIEKPQYVLSYCNKKNLPNWVAWELNSSWVGDTPRKKGRFLVESNLPKSFYRVTHNDYTNSGYDRGHLVRSKERTRTIEDNESTFEMGNVIPQTPDLNRGVWLKFENYCMDKAIKENKNMYIIAGGFFYDTLTLKSRGKVIIPDSCFKIVVFSEALNPRIEDINKLETISVAMPNISGVRGDNWRVYETTVAKIENSTGYYFFYKFR